VTLPNTISDGDDLKAAPVMSNLTDLDGRFPVQDTNQGAIAANKITFPAGYVFPTSTIPQSASQGAGNANNALDSDAGQVLSQGLSSVRRHVHTGWTEPVGSGWIAPVRSGFLTFSQTNDAVYEVPRNSQGGGPDLLSTQFTHAFTAGDGPVHAVATSDQRAYVSCRTSRLIKRIDLNSSSAPVTVIDLSSVTSNLGKLYVNRTGTYLYVVCKTAGDATYRRLRRIDIAATTPTSSELSMTDDFDIVDVFIQQSRGATSNSLGQVLIAQFDTTAAGGTVFRVKESSTDAYGGSFAAATEGTVKQYASPEFCYAMCDWHGRVAVLTQNATTISCHLLSYDEPSTPGACEMFDATITGSTPVLLKGGACTNGWGVFAQRDDGKLCVFSLASATGTTMFARSGITGAAGTYESPSGICYTGKSLVGVWREVAGTKIGRISIF
jgi:hypothetical protein